MQTPADKAALEHLKVVEPELVRQSAEEMTANQQDRWFYDVSKEFQDNGTVHLRYSIHPEIPNLRLVEGWKGSRPANEGDPRWTLTSNNQPKEGA